MAPERAMGIQRAVVGSLDAGRDLGGRYQRV